MSPLMRSYTAPARLLLGTSFTAAMGYLSCGCCNARARNERPVGLDEAIAHHVHLRDHFFLAREREIDETRHHRSMSQHRGGRDVDVPVREARRGDHERSARVRAV